MCLYVLVCQVHGRVAAVYYRRQLYTAVAQLSTAVAQLSTAVAQLSTAGHSCILPGMIVYYQAQLSLQSMSCLPPSTIVHYQA